MWCRVRVSLYAALILLSCASTLPAVGDGSAKDLPRQARSAIHNNLRPAITVSVPKTPKAGHALALRGRAPKGASVRVLARKPGMPHWRRYQRTDSNARGRWRTRLRLSPGAWDVAVQAARHTARARVIVQGRASKEILRRGVIRLHPSEVELVSGAPSGIQNVTFRTGVHLPRVGTIIVGDTSAVAPLGLLGKVVEAGSRERTISLEPVALSQAYRSLRIQIGSSLGRLSEKQDHRPSALAALPAKLKCSNSVTGAPLPVVDTTIDMSSLRASFDMDLANRYVSLLVTGHPQIEGRLGWVGEVGAACEIRISIPSIPLGPTGLTLDLTAALEASLKASGSASLEQVYLSRLAVGFVAFRDQVTYAKGIRVEASSPRLSATSSSEIELALKNEVAVMVAGRVGLFGSFGPFVGAEISPQGARTCVAVSGGLQLALGMKADLFVADWRVDLAKGKVRLGRIYHGCTDSGGESSAETLLAEVNRARAQVRWCGSKRFDPQPALGLNSQLTAAAQLWADAIVSGSQPYGHYSRDGRGPLERALAAGYSPPEGTGVNENLNQGAPTARAAVDSWVKSPPHCETMMRATDYFGGGQAGGVWAASFKCPCPGAQPSLIQGALNSGPKGSALQRSEGSSVWSCAPDDLHARGQTTSIRGSS